MINRKYRDIHPSMLGNIDILVCGNSDPGTSGVLSPFAKIDGLYFNSSDEPDEFYYNLTRDLEEKCKQDGRLYIKMDFESAHDYYEMLEKMIKFTEGSIKISGTSREGHYELVINEDSDMDDPTKPSTVGLQKKHRKNL